MKKCVIIQTYKNGEQFFVAHHQLENGSWRSKNLEDARIFKDKYAAKWFIDNKYSFGGNFVIKEL